LSDKTLTGWVFTNDSLLVYNGPEIVQSLKLALTKPMDFTVTVEQGPPGCGKTTSIIEKYRPGSQVLCPGKLSTIATRKKLEALGKWSVDFKSVVRTLDSYLVNYSTSTKVRALRPEVLLGDEGYMSRSGRWYAAAALLGVQDLRSYGDEHQIPHVPRAETPKMHLKIVPDSFDYKWITFRCPPSAVAAWGHVYDWKVRSVSKVDSPMVHVGSSRGLQIPAGCVMMGMYQADKKELRKMYAASSVKVTIMTVHESQGETFEHVWLHRFDMRKRTDTFSLYDKEPYALVALSRHTKSFKYIAPDLGDLVSKWIVQSKDVRRVKAAAEVETQGQSKEFY